MLRLLNTLHSATVEAELSLDYGNTIVEGQMLSGVVTVRPTKHGAVLSHIEVTLHGVVHTHIVAEDSREIVHATTGNILPTAKASLGEGTAGAYRFQLPVARTAGTAGAPLPPSIAQVPYDEEASPHDYGAYVEYSLSCVVECNKALRLPKTPLQLAQLDATPLLLRHYKFSGQDAPETLFELLFRRPKGAVEVELDVPTVVHCGQPYPLPPITIAMPDFLARQGQLAKLHLQLDVVQHRWRSARSREPRTTKAVLDTARYSNLATANIRNTGSGLTLVFHWGAAICSLEPEHVDITEEIFRQWTTCELTLKYKRRCILAASMPLAVRGRQPPVFPAATAAAASPVPMVLDHRRFSSASAGAAAAGARAMPLNSSLASSSLTPSAPPSFADSYASVGLEKQ